MIVLGIHETGGLGGMRKAAAVAEAAGLNICLHGVYESGITTCASNQVAATIPNLDDGNQIMVQLLAEDIVAAPSLATRDGRLPVLEGPGLGFELDRDAVVRAAERYRQRGGPTRLLGRRAASAGGGQDALRHLLGLGADLGHGDDLPQGPAGHRTDREQVGRRLRRALPIRAP